MAGIEVVDDSVERGPGVFAVQYTLQIRHSGLAASVTWQRFDWHDS